MRIKPRKATAKRKHKRKQPGFTLLETLIALAVFATMATAVLSASYFALKQNTRVEERLCAAWAADNQLSELQLQAPPAQGKQHIERRLGGREWTLDQQVSAAADPRLLRVDLKVSRSGSDQVVHRSSGWLKAAP